MADPLHDACYVTLSQCKVMASLGGYGSQVPAYPLPERQEVCIPATCNVKIIFLQFTLWRVAVSLGPFLAMTPVLQ